MSNKCEKCGKIPANIKYNGKEYCTWYCAKKESKQMIFDIAMVGLTWCFLIGFFLLTAYLTDDGPDYSSKAYRDLDETILNRNEKI